ncbi:LADA_0B09318g1_1 [Lachancea dasiensis]|uniref:LADA_0B09318g1_1 n=1 Tax=Lachancea dasiensis TaxID=1072105 RepID=A0A1G4IUN5_9SACH|nr:LADA_0B09318g1_1 [Lachancea dasiensis]
MPLLTSKSYYSDDEAVGLVDRSDMYNLSNYHVRDDSEATSSDEEAEGEDSQLGESACGETSYSFSEGYRGRFSLSEGSDVRPKRSRSGSPGRRGLGSLFWRYASEHSNQNSTCETPQRPRTEDQASEVFRKDEIEENLSSGAGSSSKFWRSWRLRHKRNDNQDEESKLSHLANAEQDQRAESDSKHKTNDSLGEKRGDIITQNDESERMGTVRMRNKWQRKANAQGTDASSFLKEKLTVISSGSETSDEDTEKLRSADHVIESPLTPLDEASSLPKEESVAFGQYEDIYQTPQDYVPLEDQFDRFSVNKNSKTYVNFLNAICLLNGSSLDVVNMHSLEEFSGAIFSLAKQCLDQKAPLSIGEPAIETYTASIDNQEVVSQKSSRISELETELSLLREKFEDNVDSLYNCRKELQLTKEELIGARNQVDESIIEASNFKSEFDAHRVACAEFEATSQAQLNHLEELLASEKTKFSELEQNYTELNLLHTDLQSSCQTLQEQDIASRAKTHELIALVSNYEIEVRKLHQSNKRLQKDFTEMDQLASQAKAANIKLKSDCQRERRKLLDGRREHQLIQGQLDIAMCHKTESLQFMAQLMISFREALCENTLQECDSYLESINSNTFFCCALVDNSTRMTEQQMIEQVTKQRRLITDFYRHFAKKHLLDQVFAKYVSFMRSNRFLSQQLRGLRQKTHGHEEHISRLLEGSKTKRTLKTKQDNQSPGTQHYSNATVRHQKSIPSHVRM